MLVFWKQQSDKSIKHMATKMLSKTRKHLNLLSECRVLDRVNAQMYLFDNFPVYCSKAGNEIRIVALCNLNKILIEK